MSDYIIRATAADSMIRAFAATTKEMTETARALHDTSPVATAALGRLMTAGAMMGSMMKGEKDLLTLQIKGDGPLGGLVVTADSAANVKGYVYHPEIVNEPNYLGKLDVGGAIGYGTLQVIKDLGLKEPYVGTTDLITGEIAEDLTYYFATSEQVPSSVGLGVLMNRNNTVCQSGGFIIQMMPFVEESLVTALEEKLTKITSVTQMLDEGMTPEDILTFLLGDFGLEINEKIPTKFYCNCTKQRVEKALAALPKKDIGEMIDDGKPIEVKCHFCNKSYEFSINELNNLL